MLADLTENYSVIVLLALCYISALSHHHQHHHHPHSRNGMDGSLLHQTGHRHKTPGAAIGTSEATAGHSGSVIVSILIIEFMGLGRRFAPD